MTNKRQELEAWLERLERYAGDQGMTARIMDNIRDCRARLAAGEADLGAIAREVDELLESVEKKASGGAITAASGESVPTERVMEEAARIAERCRAENRASSSAFAAQRRAILKRALMELRELENGAAHPRELSDQTAYEQFVRRVRAGYEKEASELCGELLGSVAGNYRRMMDSIRSLFQSLGGGAFGGRNRQFFEQYEVQRDGIETQVRQTLSPEATGSGELGEFARRAGETMARTARSTRRKRNLLAVLPAALVAAALLAGAVVTAGTAVHELRGANVDVSAAADGAAEFWDENGSSVMKAAGNSVVQQTVLSLLTLGSQAAAALGVIFFILLVLAAIAYGAYILLLGRWCRKKIVSQNAASFKAELEIFALENGMVAAQETMAGHALEEYDRQYMEVLGSLLSAPEQSARAGRDGLGQLKAEWSALRGM